MTCFRRNEFVRSHQLSTSLIDGREIDNSINLCHLTSCSQSFCLSPSSRPLPKINLNSHLSCNTTRAVKTFDCFISSSWRKCFSSLKAEGAFHALDKYLKLRFLIIPSGKCQSNIITNEFIVSVSLDEPGDDQPFVANHDKVNTNLYLYSVSLNMKVLWANA